MDFHAKITSHVSSSFAESASECYKEKKQKQRTADYFIITPLVSTQLHTNASIIFRSLFRRTSDESESHSSKLRSILNYAGYIQASPLRVGFA